MELPPAHLSVPHHHKWSYHAEAAQLSDTLFFTHFLDAAYINVNLCRSAAAAAGCAAAAAAGCAAEHFSEFVTISGFTL